MKLKRTATMGFAVAFGLAMLVSEPVGALAADLTEQAVAEQSVDAVGEGANLSAVKTEYGVSNVYTLQKTGDVTTELTTYLDNNCKGLTSPVIIYFPSGNYTLKDDNNLVLHSNVYIVAESGTTIKKSSGTNSMLRTRKDENVSNILIYGGTWDANGKGKNVFEFNAVSKGKIVNLTVKGTAASANGIQIAEGSKNCELKNVSANGNGRNGIQITSKSSASCMEVTANNNGAVGIAVDSSSTAKITKCEASSNKTNGIGVSQSTVNVDASKTKSNKENGISVANKSTVNVTNTTITGNSEYGICVSDASSLNKSATGDQKNTIQNNNWSGISATNSGTNIIVKGNTIVGNGKNPKKTSNGAVGHGIGVSESAKAEISNNVLTGNSECGISVFDKGTANIISNNISSNGRHGIGARKQVKLTLSGKNVINKNKYNGVLAADETTATITNATIDSAGEIGISIVDKSSVTLKSTTVSNSKDSNISITKGSDKKTGASLTLKSKNSITGSKKAHGIVVGKDSKGKVNITGSDNTISSNKQNGISLAEKSSATLTIKEATTVTGNKQNGIYVNGCKATMKKVTVSQNGKYGIGVDNKANITLESSKVEKNRSYGINISGSGTNATIKTTTVNKNKNVGIMVNQKATVSQLYKNKVTNNGKDGIYVKAGSKVKKVQKNTVTGHTEYGMTFYDSTVNNVKNNTLSNPDARAEVYKKGTKTNVDKLEVVSISKLKSSSKKVTGKATAKSEITVTADKKYTGKAGKNGKYSVKIGKQKKGSSVKVTAKDKYGNQVYNTCVVQ